MVVLNKNIKLIVNYVAGPIIMFFLLFTVVRQLQQQPHWKESLQQMLGDSLANHPWKLVCMFLLMIVNWGLESLKWKIALRPVQNIGFFRAYKAVLAGTCIASFTPNRVGEYLGRMLFVDPGKKAVSVAPTVLCSMSQMLVTLAAGTAGIFFFSSLSFVFQVNWLTPSFFRSAMLITGLFCVILLLIYFKFDPLIMMVNRWMEKTKRNFIIPDHYDSSLLIQILFLSVVRYIVFITQYFLLFSFFGTPLKIQQVFTGVSTMFVLMAAVPTLTFLTDLGFRWAAGVQIFQVYSSNTAAILAVSLAVWVINLIIPALVGSLLILRIKFFSTR